MIRAPWLSIPEEYSSAISHNIKHKTLNEDQKAMVVTRKANITHGDDHRSDQLANFLVENFAAIQLDAADSLSVSGSSVRSVVKVEHNGIEEQEIPTDVEPLER